MEVTYRELALAIDRAKDDPPRSNRLYKQHHALYKQMRESVAGRDAITTLMDDPEVVVRLMAAVHSLAWAPHRAEQVLEEIERSDDAHGVDAKWTLRSYRAGKLNLDW